jgi:hypothetical protein
MFSLQPPRHISTLPAPYSFWERDGSESVKLSTASRTSLADHMSPVRGQGFRRCSE